MSVDLVAAGWTGAVHCPRRPHPRQHPPDGGSRRADRLGRIARRCSRPRPGVAVQRRRSRRRHAQRCRASVGRLGCRPLLHERVSRVCSRAARRSPSGLIREGGHRTAIRTRRSSVRLGVSTKPYRSRTTRLARYTMVTSVPFGIRAASHRIVPSASRMQPCEAAVQRAADVVEPVQRDLAWAAVELLQDVRPCARRERERRADIARPQRDGLLDEEPAERCRRGRLAHDRRKGSDRATSAVDGHRAAMCRRGGASAVTARVAASGSSPCDRSASRGAAPSTSGRAAEHGQRRCAHP